MIIVMHAAADVLRHICTYLYFSCKTIKQQKHTSFTSQPWTAANSTSEWDESWSHTVLRRSNQDHGCTDELHVLKIPTCLNAPSQTQMTPPVQATTVKVWLAPRKLWLQYVILKALNDFHMNHNVSHKCVVCQLRRRAQRSALYFCLIHSFTLYKFTGT